MIGNELAENHLLKACTRFPSLIVHLGSSPSVAIPRPSRYHASRGKEQEESQRGRLPRTAPQERSLRGPGHPQHHHRPPAGELLRATAKEAEDKRLQALADQAKGIIFADPGKLTVADYLDAWLTDTARYQVSEGSYERYERTLRNHLKPFFRSIKLRELNAAHVRAFKARKIEEGLNPNTVGVMQAVLSTALNQAVDDGLIPSNPAARVKKAATRSKRPMRSLSHEEASHLAEAVSGTRDEALILLALRTGIRQGELAALRWEDLELDGSRPTITIQHSADTRKQTRVSTTKTGEERRVRIGPRMVEVLRRHRASSRSA